LPTRNTVRDYLDTVVLFERLGEQGSLEAMRSFVDIYRQANDASPLTEISELSRCASRFEAARYRVYASRAKGEESDLPVSDVEPAGIA